MAQAPGIQMTGFDVGGSNTGNQTGFRSYGFDTQNQTRVEGIDTTEGTAANAGYFDFGSFEEFQVGGAGADSGAFAGGAVLSISVKSGGDRFTGTWYSDYISERHGDRQRARLPATCQHAQRERHVLAQRPLLRARGETICRGNATKKQIDLNGDFGGPLWKQKAWFFTSWRLNDKYEYITGLGDQTQRSKLSNKYTFKGTFQVGKSNQIIGFLNKREKLQDLRGISLTVPLSAAYYQSSRNYPWKVEWTSVLGSRAFLDVLYGNWYNFFPLRPVRDYGLYDGPWEAPPHRHRHERAVAHRRQQRLPGPEALQAPVLHHAVVLQGRVGRQPRPARRLRLEARSPQPVQRPAVRHSVSRQQRQPERSRPATTRRSPASTTSSTPPAGSTTRSR